MKKIYSMIGIFVICSLNNTNSQNFWEMTNGPYGGATVKDFLRFNDSTIFLGTTEGIIKSIDNGINWERIPEVTKKVTCLAMDSTKTLYAAAIDTYGNSYLLKSSDVGYTWFQINNNFEADFTDIVITYKDTIIVGSWDNGLYRSIDAGQNWTQINSGLNYLHIYKTVILSNGILLTGTSGSGVYRSSDMGNSWISSNSGIPSVGSNGYIYVSSFLEVSPGCLLSGTQNGVYFSSNYGNSWVNRSIGIGSKQAMDIILNPDGNIYAGIDNGGGVYFSTNKGNNWNYLGLDYSIYTLGKDSELNIFAGGLSNGLSKYIIEDTTWTSVFNQGYTPVRTEILTVTNRENVFAGTKWWGLHKTTNMGQFWAKTNYQNTVENILSIDDTSIVLSQYTGVYLSRDQGNTWEQIANYSASSIYFDSTTQIIYLGTRSSGNGNCSIYASNDFGKNWYMLHNFGAYGLTTFVSELYITNNNNHILTTVVAGDNWGTWYRFYLSIDNGQTWELKSQNRVSNIIENYNGVIYGLSPYKLIISYDEGLTWITRDIGGNCLTLDFFGRLYISSGGIRISYSEDEGLNWITIDELLPYVYDIVISKSNHIYVATDNGVYFGDANSIVLSTNTELKKGLAYNLCQNYPNPFNPSTSIQYAISSTQFVTLKVYDLLGREVATLVNEEKPAGSYKVEFRMQNLELSSSIYFYKLQAGDFVETKKMLLLK